MSIELLKEDDGKFRYKAKCEYCSASISTGTFLEDRKQVYLEELKDTLSDYDWEYNDNNKCWCPDCL